MTNEEHDRSRIRIVFDMFSAMQRLEYKTEVGQEIGRGISEAITDTIKPFMIELSKRLIEEK